MGSSCDELQCRGVAFNENRQKRDAKDDDGDDYDVILDDVIENDDVTDGDDDDEDDVYGRVVFTPFGHEETSRRKRSVAPAAIPSRFHFIFFQRRME